MTGEQPEIPGAASGGGLVPTPPPAEIPALTGSTASDPIVPSVPNLLGENTDSHERRFIVVYATLGIVLLAAMGTFAYLLVVKPETKAATQWSTWQPEPGTVSKMSNQIADHVAHSYRVAEGGNQLVNVVPSRPTVTSGTTKIAINAIAIRKAPNSDQYTEVLTGSDVSGSQLFTFCGFGEQCALTGGKATRVRSRLVFREALEVALYTFKFVPTIKSVIAFMPPAPGKSASQVLLLRKGNLQDALDKPLRTTLPRKIPPLPTDSNEAEAATIDDLTLPHLFDYSLLALPTGGAAVVLDKPT